jgi:hypothetical protein
MRQVVIHSFMQGKSPQMMAQLADDSNELRNEQAAGRRASPTNNTPTALQHVSNNTPTALQRQYSCGG